MHKKENCNLKFLIPLILVFFGVTQLLVASEEQENLYYEAALFSQAAYGGTKLETEKPKLEKNGWSSFQLVKEEESIYEIQKEILNTEAKVGNLKAFTSEHGADLASLKAEYTPLENKKNIDWEDIDPVKQHYGYLLSRNVEKHQYMIAFTGTYDTYSWIFTDFMAFPTQFLDIGINVHAGFEWNRQACMRTEAINIFIQEFKRDLEGELIITGHSMGGAVAVLETAYLLEKEDISPEKIKVITFAEPCPGTLKFVDRYKSGFLDYTVFVNQYDMVPLLPMAVGYRHFDMGAAVICDEGPDPEEGATVKELIALAGERHDMKYYIDAAKAYNRNI
jgi:predicted lipase